jgi:hypothetical protein
MARKMILKEFEYLQYKHNSENYIPSIQVISATVRVTGDKG